MELLPISPYSAVQKTEIRRNCFKKFCETGQGAGHRQIGFDMRGSRKFCQVDGVCFFFCCCCCCCFLVDEGREDPNTSISGPYFKWRFAGVPMMAQHWIWLGSFVIFRGSRPVLLRSPIFFYFSRGRGPDPLSTRLDPHMFEWPRTFIIHCTHITQVHIAQAWESHDV